MPNYFFHNVFYSLLKTLLDHNFHFFESRIQANYLSLNRFSFRNFFIAKICNFITMRFYFSFQKTLIIERLAIKFFFDINTDFISNSIIFFLIRHHLHSKYTSVQFLHHNFLHKRLFQEALYVMVVIKATNQVFIVLYHKKSCQILMLSQYLNLLKNGTFMAVKLIFFNFNIPKR